MATTPGDRAVRDVVGIPLPEEPKPPSVRTASSEGIGRTPPRRGPPPWRRPGTCRSRQVSAAGSTRSHPTMRPNRSAAALRAGRGGAQAGSASGGRVDGTRASTGSHPCSVRNTALLRGRRRRRFRRRRLPSSRPPEHPTQGGSVCRYSARAGWAPRVVYAAVSVAAPRVVCQPWLCSGIDCRLPRITGRAAGDVGLGDAGGEAIVVAAVPQRSPCSEKSVTSFQVLVHPGAQALGDLLLSPTNGTGWPVPTQ